MQSCDHKYEDGSNAVITMYFNHKDKNGYIKSEIDYELCELCGKRFTVSG